MRNKYMKMSPHVVIVEYANLLHFLELLVKEVDKKSQGHQLEETRNALSWTEGWFNVPWRLSFVVNELKEVVLGMTLVPRELSGKENALAEVGDKWFF